MLAIEQLNHFHHSTLHFILITFSQFQFAWDEIFTWKNIFSHLLLFNLSVRKRKGKTWQAWETAQNVKTLLIYYNDWVYSNREFVSFNGKKIYRQKLKVKKRLTWNGFKYKLWEKQRKGRKLLRVKLLWEARKFSNPVSIIILIFIIIMIGNHTGINYIISHDNGALINQPLILESIDF